MMAIRVAKSWRDVDRLIEKVSATHEPICIAGKRHNAVLISGEDWNGIQETMHLLSSPGMRQSIMRGMKIPVARCTEKLKW